MTQSVQFYRDVLGMELLYGGEGTRFSSLGAKNTQSATLNLEQGEPEPRWGRLIFYVADVDALIGHVEIAFSPRGVSWNLRIKSSVLQMIPIRTATSCRLPGLS